MNILQNKYNKIVNNKNSPSKSVGKIVGLFHLLNKKEKLNLENLWNQSLTP